MQEDNDLQKIEPVQEPEIIDPPDQMPGIETFSDDDYMEEEYGGGFKEILSNVQREHPYLFFGILAVVFFLIILAVVSPFMMSSGNKDNGTQQTTEENTETTGTDDQVTTVNSSGLTEGIDVAFYFQDISNLNALSAANLNFLDTDMRFSSDVYLAEELITTRQVEEAIGIDIQELMTQSADKESDFQLYLESLQKLEQQASNKYLGLLETREVFLDRISLTKDQLDGTLKTLNAALDNGTYEQIEDSLEQYVLLEESLAKLQVREKINSDVINTLQQPLYLIRARIAGLIANKELVIQNLTAVDVDGAGLTIIESGEMDDLYPPLPGTEDVENNRRSGSGSGYTPGSYTLPSDDNIPRVKLYGEEQLLENIQDSGL